MQISSFNLPLLGIDWSILVAVEVASTIATILGYSEKKSRAIEHFDSFDRKQLGTRWMLPKLPLFCEKMVNLKMRDECDLFLFVEEETSSSTAGTMVIFR
jgi:hypothetical protein